MSAIIQRLTELNKLDVTLPVSNETIKINKINLEVQSKFEEFARSTDNELYTSTEFVRFIINHIKKETKRDLNYIDKLAVIQHWYNDVKTDEPIECELKTIEIPNFTFDIDSTKVDIAFELPTISKELAYLKYILANKDLKTMDVLFYFVFRYISTFTLEDDVLSAEDIPTCQELYNLLSMSKVTSITEHIDEAFKPIQPVRDLEVNPRVFFA
jgi:hypothetical protein